MKSLFNEKGHLMLKYIINQIAMSLFGMFMAATALAIGDQWLLPFGIFGLVFYYFILITFIREDGQKDAIKIAGGRMKADNLMSVKYCGIAALPGFVIAFINMMLCFGGFSRGILASIAGIFNVITRVFMFGMYNPVDTYLFNAETGVLKSASFMTQMGVSYVIYTVFTLAVCFLAYYIGLHTEKKADNDK